MMNNFPGNQMVLRRGGKSVSAISSLGYRVMEDFSSLSFLLFNLIFYLFLSSWTGKESKEEERNEEGKKKKESLPSPRVLKTGSLKPLKENGN
jgi:hypothetical protein